MSHSLWSLLVFVQTENWVKRSHTPVQDDSNEEGAEDCSLAEIRISVDLITSHIRIPVEAKGTTTASFRLENCPKN